MEFIFDLFSFNRIVFQTKLFTSLYFTVPFKREQYGAKTFWAECRDGK